MQFKIVKNPQIQPDTQNNLTTHTNENVGYVLYNDNTKKEIKDLTEDELIEIFYEYIETYNASNEPYINIEKFAIYNNQLNLYHQTINEWIKENCIPYNEMPPSLLAKLLQIAVSCKSGDKVIKLTLGTFLTKTKEKKWLLKKSVFGKKTLSNAHHQAKLNKESKNDQSEITVDDIIKELETQAKELKNLSQENTDTNNSPEP
jgi:hypothetical protein